jgi:hypothetical protein
MLSFKDFLNENIEVKVNDVIQIKDKKYLVTKVTEDGFVAESYVVVGDYIEETETIDVKGSAMYIHKNIGSSKVFAMRDEFSMESSTDYSKDRASSLIKKIFG